MATTYDTPGTLLTLKCRRCNGLGHGTWNSKDGSGGTAGTCYRCAGKGATPVRIPLRYNPDGFAKARITIAQPTLTIVTLTYGKGITPPIDATVSTATRTLGYSAANAQAVLQRAIAAGATWWERDDDLNLAYAQRQAAELRAESIDHNEHVDA